MGLVNIELSAYVQNGAEYGEVAWHLSHRSLPSDRMTDQRCSRFCSGYLCIDCVSLSLGISRWRRQIYNLRSTFLPHPSLADSLLILRSSRQKKGVVCFILYDCFQLVEVGLIRANGDCTHETLSKDRGNLMEDRPNLSRCGHCFLVLDDYTLLNVVCCAK